MTKTKVKLADKQTLVQWSVVNENGDVKDAYFEATNLKTGSKKDCGEFIDQLKTSREEVKIRIKKDKAHALWRKEWLGEIKKMRDLDQSFKELIEKDHVHTCEKHFAAEDIEICKYSSY